MSTIHSSFPVLDLGQVAADAVLAAAEAVAKAHEMGHMGADEAVAAFLGLSAAGVALFGDGMGCDGCDLVLSREVCDVVGLTGASAVDANGDPDVTVCAFCVQESHDFYTRDENGWTP